MYLLYLLLWIIYNGQITLEIFIFGIIIAALIFAFTCKFMDYSIEKEKKNWKNIFRWARYIFTLLLEIIKANFSVLRMIINEAEEIEPVLVTFETDLKTPEKRAFLANAITLTPGTITVTLEGNELTVHSLDESIAEGIDDLVFEHMLEEMEE